MTRIQHKRGATTLEDIQYTLNAAGLRTQMVDSIGTTTWAYDELNRLSSVSYPNNDAVVYGFDAVGNRTSMAENSVVTNYTYDLADRLTQSVKSGVTTSYTWDQNGNRLTKTVGVVTTTYGWDALDRMTSHAVGGTTTTYAYNGDSRRVSKSVGGSTTNFAWDVAGLGYIMAESGASANEFVWGGGLIAQLTTSGGTPTYAHADGLGSLRLLTDVAGNVAGSKQYDAYGASRGTSGATLSFGFTGEYQDSESGLIYLPARYYDPTTGRFISQDPLLNQPRYVYGSNNPIHLSDPAGAEPLEPGDGPPMHGGIEPEGRCGHATGCGSYNPPAGGQPTTAERDRILQSIIAQTVLASLAEDFGVSVGNYSRNLPGWSVSRADSQRVYVQFNPFTPAIVALSLYGCDFGCSVMFNGRIEGPAKVRASITYLFETIGYPGGAVPKEIVMIGTIRHVRKFGNNGRCGQFYGAVNFLGDPTKMPNLLIFEGGPGYAYITIYPEGTGFDRAKPT